ncbi:LOW QUALITY PROTEIN: hypothetical protein Cgig2_014257 [Carnegiea gigantea]|uniref:DDE Tnp4 domain-containing protein n=1 Tax=Carnegiea gigantea TaxID=171969 RepID=A0A9Q1QBT8_9CARY|nr:LOW QUALITY PROTEIN: hypothetical protein Cgig2_014257 [Carnegiea gigantea]
MAAHEAVKLLAVRALSHLKGSWRILSKVMWRPDKRKLPSIILACCLLHNIKIDRVALDIGWPGYHDLGYEERYCGHVSALGGTMRENLVKTYRHYESNAVENEPLNVIAQFETAKLAQIEGNYKRRAVLNANQIRKSEKQKQKWLPKVNRAKKYCYCIKRTINRTRNLNQPWNQIFKKN